MEVVIFDTVGSFDLESTYDYTKMDDLDTERICEKNNEYSGVSHPTCPVFGNRRSVL